MGSVFVGTFSRDGSVGIYTVEMEAGRLSVVAETAAEDPAYLVVNGKNLYAVRETARGSVVSYRIEGDGKLVVTGIQAVGGDAPCHLWVDGAFVYSAQYVSGTVAVFPLDACGSLSEAGQVIAHQGRSIHPRQQVPHAHQCQITPDGAFLAVCDLGMDCVLFYPRTERGIVVPAEKVAVPAGTGPRHAAFGSNGVWYVVGELSCEVLVYHGYGRNARLLRGYSTLRPQDTESYCSALRLSPDGRLLMATVRGADTMALFEVKADGLLLGPAHFDTMGKWPRDAAFSPDGRYILCACEHSGRVTSFEVGSGGLSYLGAMDVPAPACICFG